MVVGCHQIAAHLYALDAGTHKHQLHDEWLQSPEATWLREERGRILPPTAFFHRYYMNVEQYPRGPPDAAGYWAEGKIFGGVVVFDRGESEKEVCTLIK